MAGCAPPRALRARARRGPRAFRQAAVQHAGGGHSHRCASTPNCSRSRRCCARSGGSGRRGEHRRRRLQPCRRRDRARPDRATPAEAEFIIGACHAAAPVLVGESDGPRRPRARRLDHRPDRHDARGALARRSCSAASAPALVGYDPALHCQRRAVGPLAHRGARPARAAGGVDAVCVQLDYFSRYQGLLGERYLPNCKPGQVIVSTAHSACSTRPRWRRCCAAAAIAAAWLDSLEPGAARTGRPLHDLPTRAGTPRVAGYTPNRGCAAPGAWRTGSTSWPRCRGRRRSAARPCRRTAPADGPQRVLGSRSRPHGR